MGRLKILTANTALGMDGSGSLAGDLHSLIEFHTWKVVPFLLTGNRFKRLFRFPDGERAARAQYFQLHSDYRKTIEMVKKADADIVVLNEIIFQVGGEFVEHAIRSLGYPAVYWGRAAHYPDTTVCTLTASRLPAHEATELRVPQFPQMGGGGGAVALRLEGIPVTIVGCHLANGVPEMIHEQLRALVAFAQDELRAGRSPILAGDFNASTATIRKTDEFDALSLRSIQSNCPICLPNMLQGECDHIYVPKQWGTAGTTYLHFGSDHLAILADVNVLDVATRSAIDSAVLH